MSKIFKCELCDNFPDCPMLDDLVWRKTKKSLLCMECTETLLGRQLTIDDLKDCPANRPTIVMIERIFEEQHHHGVERNLLT
jgi:hypothetical protein